MDALADAEKAIAASEGWGMKVARKNVFVRDDAFVASERGVAVAICGERHIVRVEVFQNGEKQEFRCSLGALAAALRIIQPREEW